MGQHVGVPARLAPSELPVYSPVDAVACAGAQQLVRRVAHIHAMQQVGRESVPGTALLETATLNVILQNQTTILTT